MNQCRQAWTSERLWPRVFSQVDFWQTPKNIQRRRMNGWNLRISIHPWKKENHLNQTIIFRFELFIFGGVSLQHVDKLRIFFFGVPHSHLRAVFFLKMGFRWFTGCCTTLISSLSQTFFLSSAYCVHHIFTPKQKGKGLVLSKLIPVLQIWVSFRKLWTTGRSGWKA